MQDPEIEALWEKVTEVHRQCDAMNAPHPLSGDLLGNALRRLAITNFRGRQFPAHTAHDIGLAVWNEEATGFVGLLTKTKETTSRVEEAYVGSMYADLIPVLGIRDVFVLPILINTYLLDNPKEEAKVSQDLTDTFLDLCRRWHKAFGFSREDIKDLTRSYVVGGQLPDVVLGSRLTPSTLEREMLRLRIAPHTRRTTMRVTP